MKLWLNLLFVSLLLQSYRHNIIQGKTQVFPIVYNCESSVSGAVILTPSEIARVCVGEELEFTCNVTGILLEWTFPLIINKNSMTLRLFTRGITAEGSFETQTFQLIDNSTTYSFARTSTEGSPVSSRLSISALYDSHNGTEINCSDMSSSTVESTTIVVIDGQIQGIIIMYCVHAQIYY